jgi:hypothetical protein
MSPLARTAVGVVVGLRLGRVEDCKAMAEAGGVVERAYGHAVTLPSHLHKDEYLHHARRSHES